MYALRIDNDAVRESQICRLGEPRANRDKNKVREALNCLERSASLSEDDENDDNGINNSNSSKNSDGDVGKSRREDISTRRGDTSQNLLRLSVEAALAQCTLGEIFYALEKRWGRHVPSSPVISGSYITSFCGGRGGTAIKEEGS